MQSRDFIQYESNQARANADVFEATQKWRVVTNPRLRAENRRRTVSRRARRMSRILSIVTAAIFACGLIMQITIMVAMNAQSKRQDELYAEIQMLQARKRSAQVSVANLADLGRIEQGAEKLGFVYPSDGQIRALGMRLSGSETQFASANP